MASNSNTNTPLPQPTIQANAQPVSQKLVGPNYLPWSVQFMVFLKSHDLADLVDGAVPPPSKTLSDGTTNPAYTVWLKKDTCVLSWLLASITEKLISTAYGMQTSKQVWDALHTRFSSPSRSRIALLRRQLQTITQGNWSCSEFMEEAKNLVDQLAAAVKTTDDQDLISFLLGGLRPAFTPFITTFNFACRDKTLSFDDFQAEILSFETLIEAQHNSAPDQHYAFAANQKGKAPFFPRKSKQQSTTPKPLLPHKGHQDSPTTRPNQQAYDRPTCQICGKRGHVALDCYHRFDFSFQGRLPPADLAAMAVEANNSYDQNVWYADSGANAHISANRANLTNQASYEGANTVQVGNGSGQQDGSHPASRTS
ncbi:hypothetical protein Pint_26024 [Pistacia integerrima]|uniref:Uncharacterized protein n=1 Tax=Pistacia integerrima TaxID=434235 RepID=A0ACC0YG36_9ROSI|nr:hypothetical protein Pint_26024 [Pistacia integerrima]